MLKCEGCGMIMWREVWQIKDENGNVEQKLVQCENCKRIVVTDSLKGEGRI